MSNKNKVIKNILWLLSEHGIRLSATLVSTSILAKVLGVEEYGIYQYLIGLITVFSSLSYICGAEIIIPKLTTADSNQRKSLMGNGFFIRLLFSIIAYVLFIVFVYVTESKQLFYLSLILGLPILFNEAFGIVTAYLQSRTIIRYRAVVMMISLLLRMGVFIILYISEVKEIKVYASVLALEAIFIASGLLLVYHYLTKESFFSFNMKTSIELFKQGLPFFFGLVLMFIVLRLDLIMLRHLSDKTSLGLYASSMQLFNAFIVLAPMIAVSFAPLYVYQHNEDRLIKKNVLIGTLLLFCIAALSSAVIYKLSPLLIKLVFGEKFVEATIVFQYLIWISPLFFINEGLNLYIIKMQLGRMLVYKWLLVLCSAGVAYLVLIPKHGVLGAVLGLGVAYLLSCLFGFWLMFRKTK